MNETQMKLIGEQLAKRTPAVLKLKCKMALEFQATLVEQFCSACLDCEKQSTSSCLLSLLIMARALSVPRSYYFCSSKCSSLERRSTCLYHPQTMGHHITQ